MKHACETHGKKKDKENNNDKDVELSDHKKKKMMNNFVRNWMMRNAVVIKW